MTADAPKPLSIPTTAPTPISRFIATVRATVVLFRQKIDGGPSTDVGNRARSSAEGNSILPAVGVAVVHGPTRNARHQSRRAPSRQFSAITWGGKPDAQPPGLPERGQLLLGLAFRSGLKARSEKLVVGTNGIVSVVRTRRPRSRLWASFIGGQVLQRDDEMERQESAMI